MGYGIETVAAILTNTIATGAQVMTAAATQSFNIRAAASNTSPITLETVWGDFQDPGDIRIRSPRMHDTANALRLATIPSYFGPLAAEYFEQELFSQDNLTLEGFFTVAPTAAHISLAYMQIYYDDIPGIAANYRPWSGVQPNVVDYLAVPVVPSSAATAGQWGAGVAINSTVDVFKANTSYALIGYIAPVAFGAWSVQSIDVGNLQVGGPGVANPIDTRRWFPMQETSSGKPSIPIINSQNKGNTLVYISDRTISTAFELSLIFAQLSA
jgi:hypothetical protein